MLSAKCQEHLTTFDNGVATTFDHECRSMPILAKLEYVGWVEEILELNYGILKIVVLLCNWLKGNYNRNIEMVKLNEMNMGLHS
jgi:hypothetical protein